MKKFLSIREERLLWEALRLRDYATVVLPPEEFDTKGIPTGTEAPAKVELLEGG